MAMKVGRTGERIKLKNVTKVLKALRWCLRLLLLAEAQSSQRHVEMTEEAVYRAMCVCTHMSVFKQSLTKFILPNESPHPHGKYMYFFTLQTFVQYLIQAGGFFVDKTKGERSDKYQVPGLQDAVLDEVHVSFFGFNRKGKELLCALLNSRNP